MSLAEFQALLQEGNQQMAQLQYPQALETFSRCLELVRNLPVGPESEKLELQTRNAFCSVCLVLGKWDRALRELEKVAKTEFGADAQPDLIRAHLKRGEILSNRGDRNMATDAFRSAMELAEKAGDPRLIAQAKYFLGSNAARMGELDDGRNFIQEALDIANGLPDAPETRRLRSAILSQFGLYHFRLGQNEQARKYLEDALKLLEGMPVMLEEAAVRRYLGVLISTTGDFRTALEHHLGALRIYKAASCAYGQAKVYDSIGRTFLSLNRLEEAIYTLKKGEGLCRRLGAKTELATIYGKLGQVHMVREEYEMAVDYFRRDLEISTRFRNFYAMGYSYRNLGRCLIQVGDLDEAIRNLEESLGLFQYVDDSINIARVYMDLCQAHLKNGAPDRAREVGGKARTYFLGAHKQLEAAYLQALFGTIDRLEGNFEKAEAQFKAAVDELAKKGNTAWLAETYYELGVMYRSRKDNDNAVQAFKSALKVAVQAGFVRQAERFLRAIEDIDELELFRTWVDSLPAETRPNVTVAAG
ncbi:MAG: tetratricopeptide repeat protein [Candidatus Eremiobacterota bacterium]